MNIEVKGLEALIRKLEYLGENTEEIIDVGLHRGAIAIQNEAKKRVPRKTGHLCNSISVEKMPEGYSIGTNAEYAPYVEFGTGTKGDPSVPHTQRAYWRYMDENGNWVTCHGMEAQPFLHPAFVHHKKYVVEQCRYQLMLALKQRITGGN